MNLIKKLKLHLKQHFTYFYKNKYMYMTENEYQYMIEKMKISKDLAKEFCVQEF